MQEIERSLCTGNHRDCHLLFTRGEVIKGKIQNAFEALQKEAAFRLRKTEGALTASCHGI
ncbi:MAG: hypothetical protein V8T45_01220 [Oscillospiraceae bacterium]